MRDKDDPPTAMQPRASPAAGAGSGVDRSPSDPTPDAAVTPERDLYEEYVCELDKVPVLTDLVAVSQRILPPDFRQGQRPDVRRSPRPDPLAMREAAAADAAALYSEYRDGKDALAPSPAGGGAKPGKREASSRGKRAAGQRAGTRKRRKGRAKKA